MCGVAGAFGPAASVGRVAAMVEAQRHRGPDAQWVRQDGAGVIGADRLRVIDTSDDADQPLVGAGGTRLSFNGEIYNHATLRAELGPRRWQTQTDTEVLLAGFERWGRTCFPRLLGMFAAVFWEPGEERVLAVRDRFGVKPLHYHLADDGTLLLASEVGALHAAGVPARPDAGTWAAYLTAGRHEGPTSTFWEGIHQVPAGHLLEWRDGHIRVERWYDLTERVGERTDPRDEATVVEEYLELLLDSIRLRVRAHVPVGVALSGGLDSATLLSLIDTVGGTEVAASSYTFVTGDDRYDELPWVEHLVAHRAPTRVVRLDPTDVPDLASSVDRTQDGPFGGLATLAYAKLFEQAGRDGTVVLLDGQGMDEQWAGYSYYLDAAAGGDPGAIGTVQGAKDSPIRPDAVLEDLSRLTPDPPRSPVVPDPVLTIQYRDLLTTKLPRALRFNDRASMRASTELREPFLDHRVVELALRQPADRKVRDGTTKWLLRRLAEELLPEGLATAPKRPVQTPQREWLRGPLRPWAEEQITVALDAVGGTWLDPHRVRRHWNDFVHGHGDTAFFAWQWVNLGLSVDRHPGAFGAGSR